MIALRLVIDTTVVVSAALNPDGRQRTVFLLAITKPARLYVSAPILAEYRSVLARRELRIRKGLRIQFLQLIENRAPISLLRNSSFASQEIPTTTYSWNAPRPGAPITW